MVAGKQRTRKPNLWVQRSKRQTLNYMTLFFIMLLLYFFTENYFIEINLTSDTFLNHAVDIFHVNYYSVV